MRADPARKRLRPGRSRRAAAETRQAHVVALRPGANETLDVVENPTTQPGHVAAVGRVELGQQPLPPVKLPAIVHRLGDPVGIHRQALARRQRDRRLGILRVGVDPEGQTALTAADRVALAPLPLSNGAM